jgi:hypothetical protein
MAFGIESSSSGTPAILATSITWSHTVTAANLLVIEGGAGDATLAKRQATAATYNAVSATLKGVADDANFEAMGLLVLGSPATGAHNVVVTYGVSAADSVSAGVTGFTDADTASFGTVATAHANNSSPSVTVSSATGEIVIAAVASDANATITEGGTLQWEQQAVHGDSCFGAQSYSGAASVTATWTASSPDTGWAAIGMSIKPSGGGAAVSVAQRLLMTVAAIRRASTW